MLVTSYSVTYCIYVPGKPGICFHYHCAVYDECKQSDKFCLADRTRLFVQYTISLSSLCKIIWRHWTYKMPVRYILSSVWVRLSIFSQWSIIQYVGLCVFSLPTPPCDDRENIYTLSFYYHQIGSTNYYPLFRVRSWNNGVRCMSFYILLKVYSGLTNILEFLFRWSQNQRECSGRWISQARMFTFCNNSIFVHINVHVLQVLYKIKSKLRH